MIIEENNLKTMEDVGEFITNLEKEMIEAILVILWRYTIMRYLLRLLVTLQTG
jgi:hypothetical protein